MNNAHNVEADIRQFTFYNMSSIFIKYIVIVEPSMGHLSSIFNLRSNRENCWTFVVIVVVVVVITLSGNPPGTYSSFTAKEMVKNLLKYIGTHTQPIGAHPNPARLFIILLILTKYKIGIIKSF